MQQMEEHTKNAETELNYENVQEEDLQEQIQELINVAQKVIEEKLQQLEAKQAATDRRLQEISASTSKTLSKMRAQLDEATTVYEDS